MKIFFLAVCLLTFSDVTFAQGLFYFQSQPFTKVFTNSANGIGLTGTDPEGFYYGLFTAPIDTTDPSLFMFSDNYATNSPDSGFYSSGTVSVAGWIPGTPRAFLIRGWSSNLGHDWSSVVELLESGSPVSGFYGESSINVITAGGSVGPLVYPLVIPTIQSFTLNEVPEPSSLALSGFVVLFILLRQRTKSNRLN